MQADENRRRWAQWVGANVGGDPWSQRVALDAALQALAAGRSVDEAASAARAAAQAQPAGVRCRFCGSIPAVAMTVYEHNGFIILMQFRNLKGPFCRYCGLNAWRRMTNTTLLRGWLGMFSFFIAPVTVLINLVNLPKLTALTPPQPGSAMRAPADPGAGMFRRPGVYVYLGLWVVLLLVIVVPAIAVGLSGSSG